MHSRADDPRGLLMRSLLAAAVFAAGVTPGWFLSGLVQNWTDWPPAGLLTSSACCAAAVAVLAPHCSYRRWDALTALVPLYGYYLLGVLAWRTALLPFRDWRPRPDEFGQAQFLHDPAYPVLWLRRSPPPVPPRRPEAAATRLARAGRDIPTRTPRSSRLRDRV